MCDAAIHALTSLGLANVGTVDVHRVRERAGRSRRRRSLRPTFRDGLGRPPPNDTHVIVPPPLHTPVMRRGEAAMTLTATAIQRRAMHLVDLENLLGGSWASRPVVGRALEQYCDVAGWRRGDIVYI